MPQQTLQRFVALLSQCRGELVDVLERVADMLDVLGREDLAHAHEDVVDAGDDIGA